jgi:hypothetical protein
VVAVIHVFGMMEPRFLRALEWPMQRVGVWSISTATLLLTGCFSPAEPLATGVSLSIDGKKQGIRGSVSCSSHSAGDAIKVGKLPEGIYVHVAPEASGIEELELGNSTGKSLVGRDEKISLEQDGTYDYDITGEAVPKDTHDPTAPKPFELKVKCP